MQLAARPAMAAAAVLATGSILAGTPVVTPSLPDVQVPAQLTALTPLDEAQVAAYSDLIQQELSSNAALVPGAVDLEKVLFDSDSALNGVVNQLYNVDNMFLDYSENSLNSALGAGLTAGDFPASLLTGLNPANVFDGGQAGGLLNVYDQNVVAAAASATSFAPVAALTALPAAVQAFDQALIAAELGFNAGLVAKEVAAEQQVFGTDSALNGVVNRLYNVDNIILGYQENSLNSLLGANFDSGQINASLLTGLNPNDTLLPNLFDSGLFGFTGQNLAALADVAGLSGADWATLASLSPADYSTLFSAADIIGFFTEVLPSQDWASLLSGLVP